MKKAFIVILSVTAAGIFTFLIFMKNGNGSKGPVKETTIVEKIVTGDPVTVSGNIMPLKERVLKFPVTGKITGIHYKEGERVQKGAVLAEMDCSAEKLQLAELQYNIEKERRKGSLRQVELLEMQKQEAIKALEARKLKAPFSGKIINLTAYEGEYISPESTSLGTLIDDSKLRAEVPVDELNVPLLARDQKVIFKFDALPSEEYEGRVHRLSPMGRITNEGLAVMDVELIIDSPSKKIYLPYSFSADIICTTPEEKLVLSENALIREKDKIFVQKSGEEEKTEIRIRIYKEMQVIVESGLIEGDEVFLQDTNRKGAF